MHCEASVIVEGETSNSAILVEVEDHAISAVKIRFCKDPKSSGEV